jgi:hypothetical protein
MKTGRLVSLALLTLLLGACAGLPQNKDASLEALLQAAGIDSQLAALEKPIPPKSVDAPGVMLPDEVISSVNEAVAGTLKPADIRADLKGQLDRNMNSQKIAEALAFYQSAAGQQVVAVEAGQPGGRPQRNEPQILSALDNATGSSDIVSKLAQDSVSSTLDYAIANGCFGLDKNHFAGFFAGIVKKALVNAVREGVHNSLSQRYATLPPETLNAYLQFAQSASGQQFFASRNKAIGNGLQTASAALSIALTAQVSEACKTGQKQAAQK